MARSINLDLSDEPIAVPALTDSNGDPYEFVAQIGSKQLVKTIGPLQEQAAALSGLDGEQVVGQVGELVDTIMGALQDLLAHDDQADDWADQDLPIGVLVQLLGGLIEEWTGRPLDSADS